jgi:urease accessory protein
LPVIALALLAGLRGPRFGRAVLFALPVAWLVGSVVGLLLAPQVTLPVAETIVTIALGALLAADCPLPVAFVASLATLLGLIHGILNGSELARTPSSGQMAAAGVAVALFVAVSLLTGQASSVRLLWARVAVRVVGSWIVAIGLLMLGWAMRVPGQSPNRNQNQRTSFSTAKIMKANHRCSRRTPHCRTVLGLHHLVSQPENVCPSDSYCAICTGYN